MERQVEKTASARRGRQTILSLLETIADPGARGQRRAALTLVKRGARAVPALLSALADGDVSRRAGAASVLGLIGNPVALPALINALGDDAAEVRRMAAFSLGEIRDASTIPALRAALIDPDEEVCWRSAHALAAIGAEAIPVLMQALTDASPSVRASAAYGLDSAGEAAIPDLIHALHDPDEEVRRQAASALMTSEAVPFLIALLENQDADSIARTWAAWDLGQIGDPAAVPALTLALEDRDKSVREEAAQALKYMKKPPLRMGEEA